MDSKAMAEFIAAVASNSIVAEDFTEGNEVFNEVVTDARQVCAEQGINWTAGEAEAGYSWNSDSALWQVQHGERGTERTGSAFDYLESSLTDGDAETCRDIALRLLSAAEDRTEHNYTFRDGAGCDVDPGFVASEHGMTRDYARNRGYLLLIDGEPAGDFRAGSRKSCGHDALNSCECVPEGNG